MAHQSLLRTCPLQQSSRATCPSQPNSNLCPRDNLSLLGQSCRSSSLTFQSSSIRKRIKFPARDQQPPDLKRQSSVQTLNLISPFRSDHQNLLFRPRHRSQHLDRVQRFRLRRLIQNRISRSRSDRMKASRKTSLRRRPGPCPGPPSPLTWSPISRFSLSQPAPYFLKGSQRRHLSGRLQTGPGSS